jgi:hypothetical protein
MALAKINCSASCRYDVRCDDAALFSKQADDAQMKSAMDRGGHTEEDPDNVPVAEGQRSDCHLESPCCKTEETR